MAPKLKLPKLGGRAAATQATPATPSNKTATGLATSPNPTEEMGSSQAVSIIELVPDLTSAYTRLRTYTYMMNDSGVSVSIRAAKTPVLGADYYIEPYSEDPNDQDIAEFVKDNVMTLLLSALEDILKMYEDGYSVLEKVYEERVWAPTRAGANKATYTMLKKLAVRPISTISSINYDNNGEIKNITQKAIQADRSTVDKKFDPTKLMIFTFQRNGGDITGKSLLRTAYPHWYYKTHFYKIDAIQKERHALGVPRAKLLAGYNKDDKVVARNILRNLRANEESFILQTPNVDFDFLEIGGGGGHMVDVLASADHHNVMILMNVMAQFLALGLEGKGGGRATGGAQTDIFMKSLKYIANYICEVINVHLIPELVIYNFPTTNFPKLGVRNIGETRDLQMIGSALSNMLAQGGITTDAATENWLRQNVFDMPQKQPDAAANDPNARQKNVVVLYDAQGNEVKAIPQDAAAANNTDTTDTAGAAQKGNVNGGTGFKGKPTNAPE